MNKMKLTKVCLLGLIAICCLILIIPSANMISELTKDGDISYENITGDLVGYIYKKNYAGIKTNYEMISAVSRFQVIVLAANAVLAGILILGEFMEKKIPLVWLLLLIVSVFEIKLLGSSAFFLILSFIPVVLSIVYKIIGGNRKKKVSR